MKNSKITRMAASILTLAILAGLIPTAALATEDVQEPTAQVDEVIIPTADPMLGVQSGVGDGPAQVPAQPRSREELLNLEGVNADEDGTVISVDAAKVGEISEEELDLLFNGEQTASFFSMPVDENRQLRDRFGLTDEEIELGSRLHGSMLVFTSQLADLVRSADEFGLTSEQVEVQAALIASGYSNMQAQQAVLAKDILGLSLEQMKAARIAEAEVLLDDATEQELWVDDAENLSNKLGLPRALVSEVLQTTTMSIYEIEQAMAAALEELYAYDNGAAVPDDPYTIDDDAAVLMSLNTSTKEPFAPEEVLGKPYSYDQQGNFNVNINTGAYSYAETDLSIPGKNGLDLVLTRQYHSDQANTMQPLGYYDKTNRVAFTVFYRWLLVDRIDQYGNTIFKREVEDHSQCQILDAEKAALAIATKNFTLAQYNDAVNYMNWDATQAVHGEMVPVRMDGKDYGMALVPDIRGYGQAFNNGVENYQDQRNYDVNEFALGQGWMLGLSHMRWVYPGYGDYEDLSQRKELILSDGTRYYIEDKVGTSGSYLVDYEYGDKEFRQSHEYPGASYGLYYKDGKVEYFDGNGRNIAIRDRFGNTITIEYTLSDDQKQVQKIVITDTLNNKIIYTEAALPAGSTHKIGTKGKDYNKIWKLTFNGSTVRTYYCYEQEEPLRWDTAANGDRINRVTSNPRWLVAVADEQGELTEYSNIFKKTRFNCFLQPSTNMPSKSESVVSANDGYDLLVLMHTVTYPNGGEVSVRFGPDTVRRIGTNGYIHYGRCENLKTMSSLEKNPSSSNVTYQYGDFDNLAGQKAFVGHTYRTTVQNYQIYPFLDADGNILNNLMTWHNYDLTYEFGKDDQNTRIVKRSYKAMPTRQNGITSGLSQNKNPWISQTIDYGYYGDKYRWPTTISTTYYDSDSVNTNLMATEHYEYSNKGNITSHTKPNGQVESYYYDETYSIPLTITCKQNSSTTLVTTNTLSSDKKSIIATETKSNGATVSKSAYRYDSYGQLVGQDDYKDAEHYVTTNYSYNYATSALPIQVSVAGVKTANGVIAAGSPGFAAGTVARKQSYNKRGWLMSETDANGKTTSYAYDPVGRITKVTYPDGTTQSYSYNVKNGTVTYTDQAGSKWLCSYGKSGKLLSVKDLTNNKVLEKRSYDQYDRLVKHIIYGESSPDQTTYYRYDTDGRLIELEQADTAGNTIYQELYQYEDGIGKVTKTVTGDANAPSVKTTSYWDNMGNTVKTGVFRNGVEEISTFAYDYLGNQTQSKTAFSASKNCAYTTSSTYNHAGQVLSTTDASGNTVTYTYDWLGNQLTKRLPKDQSTDPAKTQYPTVYQYDAMNRLVRVKTPLAAGHTGRTEYTYDANGNVIQEYVWTGGKDSSGARNMYYTYDSLNRVTQVKGNAKQDFQSFTDRYQYTNYTYDVLGNIKTMSIGDGTNWHTTQYTYDRYSRLLTQKDPLGQTESYTYDLNGNLTSKTDRRGITATNTYDAMGRLTGSVAGLDSLSYTYTMTGQRQTATSNGDTITYTYDAAGNLLQEISRSAIKTMTYGIGGLRTGFTVTANNKTYLNSEYDYNKLGQLTKLNSGNVEAHYSYDSNGNVTNVTNGNGTTANYTYNKADLVTEIKNKHAKTELSNFKYTYAADGNQLTKTDTRGTRSIQTSYTYDGLNRLIQESQTGTSAFTNTYAYDDYSNRSQATLAGAATNYTYDANNRLLSTTGWESASYTYDANGNMTQAVFGTGATVTCTYDGFNRLQKVSDNNGETVYTYDADGLRSSSSESLYVWDQGQLVATIGNATIGGILISDFTLPEDGCKTVQMPALASGVRYYAVINGTTRSAVAKYVKGEPMVPYVTITGEEKPEIPPVAPYDRIVLDFGSVSMEMDCSESESSLADVYVVGFKNAHVKLYDGAPTGGSSGAKDTVYIRGLGLIASRTDNVPTYYHYDAHGSVVQTTDASGNVIHNYSYDAFGVEQNADPADTNPFRYCGEQYDTETGNYYLRARYYAPGVGRFTQEDTHWNPRNMVYGDTQHGLYTYIHKPDITAVIQAGNLYGYCLNNSVMYVDVDGEIAASIAIGAAEVAASGETMAALEGLAVAAGYLLTEQPPMPKLKNFSGIGEQMVSANVAAIGAQISQAKGTPKTPDIPRGLEDKETGKIKTPDSHRDEWDPQKGSGKYKHRDTGWIAEKDKAGHFGGKGSHWDMSPGRGSGHINVGLDGEIIKP